MATRLHPKLMDEHKGFGMKQEAMQCYSCGNCGSVCSLNEGQTAFPRRNPIGAKMIMA